MSIGDDIEPKLADLRREANASYDKYIHDLVREALSNPTYQPETWDEARDNRPRVFEQLDQLCSRFRAFYDLKLNAFRSFADTLASTGGVSTDHGSPIDPGPHGSIVPPGGGTDVPSMLYQAWNPWVLEVLSMINEEHWSSTAATTFKNNFVLRFEDAMWRQAALSTYLARVGSALNELVWLIEAELIEAIDAAISAFRGEDDPGPDIPNLPLDLLAFVPVVGDLLDAASLGNDLGKTVYAIVQGRKPSVSEMLDASTHPRTWGISIPVGSVHRVGGRTLAVIHGTWDAITKLEANFLDLDKQLAARVDTYLSNPSTSGSGLDVQSEPADYLNGGFRKSIDTGQGLLVDLVGLYRAGYRNLPAARDRYEYAAGEIPALEFPHSMTSLFPRLRAKALEGRADLYLALERTAMKLRHAGDLLLEAAKGYDLTDNESASAMAKFAAVAPPPPPVQTVDQHGHPL